MDDAVLECGGADLGEVSRQQTGELAQERSMIMRRIALRELHVGQPLWFWRRGANAAKRPTSALWHPGVVISNTLATVWIAYHGSVVKCARSQVRQFTP